MIRLSSRWNCPTMCVCARRPRRRVPGARWVPAENCSLSAFIGNVPENAFADIADALSVSPRPGFNLEIEGVGHFARSRARPRLWAGVARNPAWIVCSPGRACPSKTRASRRAEAEVHAPRDARTSQGQPARPECRTSSPPIDLYVHVRGRKLRPVLVLSRPRRGDLPCRGALPHLASSRSGRACVHRPGRRDRRTGARAPAADRGCRDRGAPRRSRRINGRSSL